MRVLLVEDDEMLGAAVEQGLRDEGYAADWALDGQLAQASLAAQRYDVVLLDLTLPKVPGLDVLQGLRRERNPIPVIIITARDDIDMRIRGLDLGADDYVIKPFALRELLARMRAVVRRRGGHLDNMLSCGALTLDTNTHEATYEGKHCRLTAREFALLNALLLKPGKILSRSELEDRIYGWNEEVESNAVDFLIHGIRRKLGSGVIENIRGAGWLIRSET
ncbi:response regulator [Mangrovitalea sediminis]|uniref:response regulator n=1 Tax=Mangrovitalea sediminis TaxID=1982043 RepID=UPI000BE5499D|nr:response regulator transcription factor [Mangrovitalea sediminis]